MAGSNVHSPSQLGDSKGARRGGTDLPSALEANEPSHFSVHKWLPGGRPRGNLFSATPEEGTRDLSLTHSRKLSV